MRQLLVTTPDMPATVIAEWVGWTGSLTWFRDNVRRLRPEHRPIDPADRLIWLPGDAAEVRLVVPAPEDPARGRVEGVDACAGDHRGALAVHGGRMIPTRHTLDLLLGWELIQQFSRVPRRLFWDNESGIGRGKRHAQGVGAFADTLATTIKRLNRMTVSLTESWSDATDSSRRPSCPDVTSPPRPTSTPSSPTG